MANLINQKMIDRGSKKCYTCKNHKQLKEFCIFTEGAQGGKKKRGSYITNDCLECKRNKDKIARGSFGSRSARNRQEATRPRPEKCEVCNKETELCFDHCHITGFFRGWICRPCNSTLGWARDDPDRLHALADYIE